MKRKETIQLRKDFWSEFSLFLKNDNKKIYDLIYHKPHEKNKDLSTYRTRYITLGKNKYYLFFKFKGGRIGVGIYLDKRMPLFNLRNNYDYLITLIDKKNSKLNPLVPVDEKASEKIKNEGGVSIEHEIYNNNKENWFEFFNWYIDAYYVFNEIINDVENNIIDLSHFDNKEHQQENKGKNDMGKLNEFIKYINTEIKGRDWDENIKTIQEQRSVFIEKYPLTNLINLTLDEYSQNGGESFKNYIENRTSRVGSGSAGSNNNWIFIPSDNDYICTDTRNRFKGETVNDKFLDFKNQLVDHIQNFDINNYISSKNLENLNVLKYKSLRLYKNELVLFGFSSSDISRKLLDYLGLEYTRNDDVIESNIKLTNEILRLSPALKKENIDIINIIIFDYYLKYASGAIENTEEQAAQNIILYGVPGSGKSYKIKEKIAGIFKIEKDVKSNNHYEDEINSNYKRLEDKSQIKRIVFHPDYTYSDFVGQILPTLDNDKNIKYEFKAGPFTQILKSAITNPKKEHFLIIEEINRGNAAAIFGDIFQLLDRKENGESEYTINNEDIENEINKEIIERNKKEENKKDLLAESISIPSNLWLLATMNTSDQNVYTLDTAFQRRWNMELIPNDLENKNPKLDFAIEGLNIKWLPFAKVVNKILEGSSNSFSGGDKRLGAWFIRPDKDEENTKLISKELFANKVLKYLWDDAFKYNTSEFFSEKCKTLENVIINYKKDNFDTLSLFADKVKEELEKNSIKKPDTLLSDESE